MADHPLSLTKALSAVFSKSTGKENLSLLQAALTAKEVELVEKRLRVARLLRLGYPYTSIQRELKVSAATVASVADQLKSKSFTRLVEAVEKELERFRWFWQSEQKKAPRKK